MRYFFFTIAIIFSTLLLSCRNDTKTDQEVIKAMEESLKKSNAALNRATYSVFNELQGKLYEAGSQERAKIWYLRADRIIMFSKIYYDYIDALKKEVPLSQKKVNQLFSELKKYQMDIYEVDSLIRITFETSAYSFDSATVSSTESIFYQKYFDDRSNESQIAFLTQLQNRIKNFESRTVVYCNQQVGAIDGEGFFSSYAFIVGQNYEVIKKGTNLVITAGVGFFSTKSKPEILINGNTLDINQSGYGSYKTKINKSPGKYFIPVKITYTDQDGKKQIVEKNVEYIVTKECDQ